jgi:hypothetical protein
MSMTETKNFSNFKGIENIIGSLIYRYFNCVIGYFDENEEFQTDTFVFAVPDEFVEFLYYKNEYGHISGILIDNKIENIIKSRFTQQFTNNTPIDRLLKFDEIKYSQIDHLSNNSKNIITLNITDFPELITFDFSTEPYANYEDNYVSQTDQKNVIDTGYYASRNYYFAFQDMILLKRVHPKLFYKLIRNIQPDDLKVSKVLFDSDIPIAFHEMVMEPELDIVVLTAEPETGEYYDRYNEEFERELKIERAIIKTFIMKVLVEAIRVKDNSLATTIIKRISTQSRDKNNYNLMLLEECVKIAESYENKELIPVIESYLKRFI